MDTSLMVVLSSIGLQMAKGLDPNALTAVTAGEVVKRLRTKYNIGFAADSDQPLPPTAFDWAALGAGVRGVLRAVPSSGPHMCVRAASRCATLTRAGWGR